MRLHMHLFPSTPFFFVILTITSVHLPASLCSDDAQFLACGRTFQCGNITNISYPFWGNDRPESCGLPGFKLDCQGEITTITITTLSFRVLKIDNSTQALTVARSDYWNNVCPSSLRNTTIDFTLFNYASDLQNLTLYYGCLTSSLLPEPGHPSCPANSSNIVGYYLTRDEIIGSAAGNNKGICSDNVKVPVFRSAADAIERNLTSVGEGINGGFGLQWIANDSVCEGCAASGGRCGHNWSLGKFACYCANGPFVSTCGSTPNASAAEAKKKLSITLGTALAGAGLTGIIVGCWIFYCIQRRKDAAAKSKSVALSSTVPSTNDVPAATNFSRSTRSYPSSKYDLEKGSTYFGVHVFSYNELEEATGNFDSSRELGEGGFGTVYYGKLQDGCVVAVKRLYENTFKRVEQFMNEVEILTRLQHENLVKLYGCTSKRSRELLLVYEYIPNGTVADHLHGNRAKSGLVSWPVRLSIAIETADALAYLHRSDIIHRDVKTNNILLDNNFRVKVADFGLSRLFPTDVTHVSTAPQGTPGYVDPEYYQCYQLTTKSDVYSFGVVLIELISSKQAVDTNRHRHDINLANMAINKIQNHTLHELVDPSLGFEKDNTVRRMTTLVAELAFQCLQQERDMRPSMEEVLKILRGIQSEEVDTQKAEVVDIRVEDVGQLRLLPPPLSPDSVATEKWASDSALPHSF